MSAVAALVLVLAVSYAAIGFSRLQLEVNGKLAAIAAPENSWHLLLLLELFSNLYHMRN